MVAGTSVTPGGTEQTGSGAGPHSKAGPCDRLPLPSSATNWGPSVHRPEPMGTLSFRPHMGASVVRYGRQVLPAGPPFGHMG